MNRASKNEPKPEGLAQVVIPEKKKKKKEPSSSHNNGIMQKSTIKHSMIGKICPDLMGGYGVRSKRSRAASDFVTTKSSRSHQQAKEGKEERKIPDFLKSLGWGHVADDDPRFFGPTLKSIAREYANSKCDSSKPVASKPVVTKSTTFDMKYDKRERGKPKEGRHQSVRRRLYESPVSNSNPDTTRQSEFSKTDSKDFGKNIEKAAGNFCQNSEISRNNIQKLSDIFRSSHFGLPLPIEADIWRTNLESDQFNDTRSKKAMNSGETSRDKETLPISQTAKHLLSFNQPKMSPNYGSRGESLDNGADFNVEGIPEAARLRSTAYFQSSLNASGGQKESLKYLQWPAVDECHDRDNDQTIRARATVNHYPTNRWSVSSFQPSPAKDCCYPFEASSFRPDKFAQEHSATFDSFENCQSVHDVNNLFGVGCATIDGRYRSESLYVNLQSSVGYNTWDRRSTPESFYRPVPADNPFPPTSDVPYQFKHKLDVLSHYDYCQPKAPPTYEKQPRICEKKKFGHEMSQTGTRINLSPSEKLIANHYDLGLCGYSESWNRRMSSSAYNNHMPMKILPSDSGSYIPEQTVNLSAGPEQFRPKPASPTGYTNLAFKTPFEEQMQTGIRENIWLEQRPDQGRTGRAGNNRFSPDHDARLERWSVPTDTSTSARDKTFDWKTNFVSPVTTYEWRAGSRSKEQSGQKNEETQTSGEYSSTLYQRREVNRPAGSQRVFGLYEARFYGQI